MRYGRYLRMEKNIAASDTGGILERWRYGRRLLMDGKATTPNGNLKHGVLDHLIAEATAGGFKLSKSEINYRLQCARAYATEAEISTARGDFNDWTSLRNAGFPPVELPPDADPGEPFDPRNADEKRRDFENEVKRRHAMPPDAHMLPGMSEWNPPERFNGDEHGPRTPLKELRAACDRSEEYTARMAALDERRRAYVDELEAAVGGDLDKTWYEAEQRRKGLDVAGVTDWGSLAEIMDEFWRSGKDSPDFDDDQPPDFDDDGDDQDQ